MIITFEDHKLTLEFNVFYMIVCIYVLLLYLNYNLTTEMGYIILFHNGR